MTSAGRTAFASIAAVGLVSWPTDDAATSPAVAGWRPLPANAPFDYQIGGDYPPADQVRVVVRDWFSGDSLPDRYSICYVNAFQTQSDEDDVDRPDERSNWPAQLVLSGLGDDPEWEGEYRVDIATAQAREEAAAWVEPMLQACVDRGFDAVELDNLDSWTRFEETATADLVPFGPTEAAAYATLLIAAAHARGLAVAQKNALELGSPTNPLGFDFLIVEQCGELGECDDAARLYGDAVLAVEYEPAGFAAACDAIGDRSSVVWRDIDLSPPDSPGYRYQEC